MVPGKLYFYVFDIYALHDLEFDYRIKWAKRIAESFGYTCFMIVQW